MNLKDLVRKAMRIESTTEPGSLIAELDNYSARLLGRIRVLLIQNSREARASGRVPQITLPRGPGHFYTFDRPPPKSLISSSSHLFHPPITITNPHLPIPNTPHPATPASNCNPLPLYHPATPLSPRHRPGSIFLL